MPNISDIILAMKLIVGLGNPGQEYAGTRHNFGFMAVDSYTSHRQLSWSTKSRLSADVATAQIGGEKVIFIKPLTYYNLVGEAIQKTMNYYRININDILVIHDEMALPLGTIRTRKGGSDAGNNGIKNTINIIGPDFARVRIGSGLRSNANGDSQPTANRKDYVLGHLNQAQAKILQMDLSLVDQIITQFVTGQFIETTYHYF